MKTAMEKAMDSAVNYLSYRSRTEKEVIDKLSQKNYSEKIIAEIIKRLKEYHYIDDCAYLKNYLLGNAQMTRYGKIRIVNDLQRKGLKESVLDQIDHLYPRKMEKKFCAELAAKHQPLTRGKSIPERKKKLYNKLLRLGYEGSMILDCFGDLEWEREESDSEKEDQAKIRVNLELDYEKYKKRQMKKGYSSYQLNQRIFRNLAGRGYSFEMIKEIMDEKKAHFEE